MCGIAGIVGDRGRWDGTAASEMCAQMCGTLVHRGPDDSGIWIDQHLGVVLGHRRLSILDLSPLGRNPMAWDDGRLRITYNGEIYNFRELRRELEAERYSFRSQTDTEVILAAYDQWGPACVERFIGMFAFALWDEPRKRLMMARDRLGKKPLYYSVRSDRLSFASELKALVTDPSFPRTIDADALKLYFRYGYIPAPYSIFRAARKLPPAHIAIFEGDRLDLKRYWDPVATALEKPLDLSQDEADRELERLLKDAVERRMIADVPVGAFLSGGIDSSLVVALMQEVGPGAAKTFTIKFDNPAYDESEHAAAVATHLGTDHHEDTCSVSAMLEMTERLPEFFDEPFADSSAIPTYLVSLATRRHVTVALSGDGGDELFFGYPRYFFVDRAQWLLSAPRPVRLAVAHVASRAPWRRVQRVADVLRDEDADRYKRFICYWGDRDLDPQSGPPPDHPAYSAALERLRPLSAAERSPVLDLVSYLPEDILTKVDRASMAASLETRCPLLDHRIAEFAVRLPLHMKTDNRRGKLPLRRLLEKRVPSQLIDRPKMGFGVPLADWFRGPLRARMTAYVEGPLLETMGLQPGPARRLWHEFQAGRPHRADLLWSIFAFGAWVEAWKPDSAAMEVPA